MTGEEGVGTPTPIKLSGVMAEDAQLVDLAARAKARAELDAMRNQRGMFTIKEVIHHGEYYRVRYVEVHDINEVTVDAVLISSPYSYGSWRNAEPAHHAVRRQMLDQLVRDLRTGQVNRSIGWSTFTLTPPTNDR